MKKIVTYKNLLTIKQGENGEEMVNLGKVYPEIVCKYEQKDMLQFTGNNIFVRKKVADRLYRVSKELKKINSEYSLKIVYGYRHPYVQNKYFVNERKKIVKQYPNYSEYKINSLVHAFVAVPDVAGHPTGGAVDVTFAYNGKDVDMGTRIADFSSPEKILSFSKNITKEQIKNRKILRDSMSKYGFAPFLGEWWHFSYGDKEWAFFYGKKKSLYSSLDFEFKEKAID